MAILDDCPGLKAEILVDGKPLREYDDDEKGSPKAITKYIEARSGAEFSVSYTFSWPFPREWGVRAYIEVDGEKIPGAIFKPNELSGQHSRRGFVYRENGQGYCRNFSFTSLSIVEEVGNSSDAKALQRKVEKTGCITIAFRFVTNIRERVSATSTKLPHSQLSALGDLPEKALKGDARSHQATMGAAKKYGLVATSLVSDLVDHEAFATFHFKYRSKDALKALRILPRDDEIVPQADAEDVPLEERPEEELTPEELREALRRMRKKREAEAHSIKRERDTDVRVKRERDSEVADQEDDDVTVVKTRQKRPRVDPDVIVLD